MSKFTDIPSPIDQDTAPVSVASPPPRVRFVEVMPNKMWSPQITALIRVALAEDPIACAQCGKLKRKLWTMLAPFHATTMLPFTLERGIERKSLELVCTDHPLAPAKRIAEVLADEKEPWPWEEDNEVLEDDDESWPQEKEQP